MNSLSVSSDQLSVTTGLFNKFVNLIPEVSSIWKRNRQLWIGRSCSTVRLFVEYWGRFTWSGHWETDLLSCSWVTSKSPNRLRSSAAVSFKDSFSKCSSGVEKNQITPLTKFMEICFVFIIEKLKITWQDKALLSLRHFCLIFGWFTVTWWRSSLLKILYCIFSLPFKKQC